MRFKNKNKLSVDVQIPGAKSSPGQKTDFC